MIIVAAILGTIQEVIYRQAADGVFSSTHHEPEQVQVNETWRRCSQRKEVMRELYICMDIFNLHMFYSIYSYLRLCVIV